MHIIRCLAETGIQTHSQTVLGKNLKDDTRLQKNTNHTGANGKMTDGFNTLEVVWGQLTGSSLDPQFLLTYTVENM